MAIKESIKISALDLKIARIKAGLRQYQVASQVHIAPNRLSEIESGRREPTPKLLRSILHVIRVQSQTNSQRPQRGVKKR